VDAVVVVLACVVSKDIIVAIQEEFDAPIGVIRTGVAGEDTVFAVLEENSLTAVVLACVVIEFIVVTVEPNARFTVV